MRYAYALTTALLIGGTAATMVIQTPSRAQTAQNDNIAPAMTAPRAGAPMSFADMVTRLQPAVVNISTTQRVTVPSNPFAGTPFGDFFGFGGQGDGRPQTRQGQSLGSGFLISNDGFIVTNNHVISAGTRSAVVETITVQLADKREFRARVVGRDQASDLAVLKIDAGNNLPFVRFGDSARARVGDWVIAIGQPYGLGSTVTAGIISALHRVTGQGGPYDRFIQTDAAINSGNSGGPMFDMNGNVIGINSQIFTPTGGNVGIGFAIPAEQAMPIVESLRAGERIRRGYLGIQLNPMTPEVFESLGLPKNQGELVAGVEPDGAAARAGIRQGDVIVRINNRDVTPDQSLSFIVANLPVGSRVPIELIRNGQRQTVTATLGERPSDEVLAQRGQQGQGLGEPDPQSSQQAAQGALGLAVAAITPEIARQLGLAATIRGVVVTGIDPSSDAAQKGFQRGDIITAMNLRPVATPADVTAAVNAARQANRQNVLVTVQRGNRPATNIPVRLGSR